MTKDGDDKKGMKELSLCVKRDGFPEVICENRLLPDKHLYCPAVMVFHCDKIPTSSVDNVRLAKLNGVVFCNKNRATKPCFYHEWWIINNWYSWLWSRGIPCVILEDTYFNWGRARPRRAIFRYTKKVKR